MAERHYPFRRANEINIGQKIVADSPSAVAAIKHGRSYIAEDTKMSDHMGYVHVKGDPQWYRPYLFKTKE